MKSRFLTTLIFPFLLCSCTTTPKTWGNAKYSDAGYAPEQETHYNEGLDEYDQRRLVTAVIGQLEKCPKMRKNSTFMLAEAENQTSTEIDVAALNREIEDHLVASGFSLVAKSSRPALLKEMEYQSTGFTNPALAAVKGRQAGVEYLLRSVISAKSQNTDSEKFVRYRMTLQAVNLESSVVMCAPAAEIKKKYERTRVAL